MIESESRPIDEFSPTSRRNWESQIRILVRIASITIFGFFLMKIFERNVAIFAEISIGINVFILAIFVVGLAIGFLQLRYINLKRNKLTNIGGIMGFTGLFLTVVPCSCELIFEGVVSTSILNVLLISGLLLTIIGFFAEVTQLDQIFVYFIQTNYKIIFKYTISVSGAFLVNFGVLYIFVWPRDLVGIWAIIIGLTILLVTWYKQITQLIWENKLHILRTIELTISEIFLLYMLLASLSPIIISGVEINIETFFVTLIFGVASLGILYIDLFLFRIPEDSQTWSSRFFKRILYLNLYFASMFILLGILYPESLLQGLNDLTLFFRVFYTGTGFLLIYRVFFKGINQFMINTVHTIVSTARYLWSIRIAIARGFMTISGFTLIILTITPQFDYLADYIHYLLIIAGIGLLYLAWLSQINNAIIQTAHAIKKTLVLFGHFVWDTGGAIKQATIDTFQYLWLIRLKLLRAGMTLTGGSISLYAVSNPSLGSWVQPILFGLGLAILYAAWYVRVNDITKQLVSAIVNGFILFGTYIKNTGVAIKEALISFGQSIWLIRMGILRAGMTIVGPILMVYGLMSSSFGVVLQGFLFGNGLWIFYAAWYSPINNFFIRMGHSLVNSLKALGRFIWDIGVAIKDAFISLGQYLWLIRGGLLRVGMTILGPVVMLFSIFTPSLGLFIQVGFFTGGLAILYGAWITPINEFIVKLGHSLINGFKTMGHYVWDIGVTVKGVLISFGQYLWLIRVGLLRAGMTTLGPIVMLYSLFTPSLGLFIQGGLFVCGLVILYGAWYTSINRFFINLGHSLINGFKTMGLYVWDIGVTVKGVLISFGQYLWLIRVGLLRAGMTILGPIVMLYSLFTPSLGLFIQGGLFVCGLAILYGAWYTSINSFTIRLAHSIINGFKTFGNYIWVKRLAIFRSILTGIGPIMILYGIFTPSLGIFAQIGFSLLGLVLLYIAWVAEVNEFIIQTAKTINTTFVNFSKYLWNHREDILRATMTIIGLVLIVYPVYYSSLDPFLGGVSIISGLVFLTIAWFAQISNFFFQTGQAIIKLFISIGQAVKQSILDFCYYMWSLRWKILRLSMTLAGLILNFLALMRIYEGSDIGISLLFVFLGSVLLILAWTKEIAAFLELTQKILLKTVYALLNFGSRLMEQILKIIGAFVDSIIYIAIVTLGFTAFGYGVILVITGLLNDQGDWTKAVIYPIPVIGDILWLFASILQGIPVGDVENLVGIFANDPVFVLLLLGLIFVSVGIVVPFITYFSRDSIKISNLQRRFGDRKDEEVYKGGKGGK
ncbi:MAG: hypothetical protein ACW98I_06310 [Candidatus Hodarchaeales archaeon]|jgi:hypothetical protein